MRTSCSTLWVYVETGLFFYFFVLTYWSKEIHVCIRVTSNSVRVDLQINLAKLSPLSKNCLISIPLTWSIHCVHIPRELNLYFQPERSFIHLIGWTAFASHYHNKHLKLSRSFNIVHQKYLKSMALGTKVFVDWKFGRSLFSLTHH